MKRQIIISFLLAICLLAILPVAAQAAAWDGTIANSFGGGRGTEQEPYLIANGAQLAYMAQEINEDGNLSDDHFKLTADINLNNKPWTPIGTEAYPFLGTFDGAGYSIEGLSINNGAATTPQGLFGYIGKEDANADDFGSVFNLNVTGNVTGQNYVGGLVGYMHYGKIRNCTYDGTVTGKNYVGGLVGYNGYSYYINYKRGSEVSYSVNKATVTGSDVAGSDSYVGGIAGYNAYIIEDCTNEGAVTATGANSYLGGIVGKNYGGTVDNCNNEGALTSDAGGAVGGIVGINNAETKQVTGGGRDPYDIIYNGIVVNCYNTQNITGLVIVGGIVGKNDVNSSVINCYNIATVTGKAGATFVGGIVGDNSAIVQNCYNTGTATVDAGGSDVAGSVVGNNANGTITNCYWLDTSASQGVGSGTGVTENITSFTNSGDGDGTLSAEVTIDENTYASLFEALNADAEKYHKDNDNTTINLKYWVAGTAGSYPIYEPYWIDDKDTTWCTDYDTTSNFEIDTAAELAGLAWLVTTGTTFEGKTITLEQNIDLKDIQWTPIGTSNERFLGIFDGQEKKITGLYINTPNDSNKALFVTVGERGKGMIKNLHVEGDITAKKTGGIAVTLGNDATVSNCSYRGTITTISQSGGIVSDNLGTIINCVNYATITSTGSRIGGIAATNNSIIVNCYNKGNIEAKAQAGGIAGESNGKVENCYSIGEITGDENIGGLVGLSYGTASNSYWLNTGNGATAGIGLTETLDPNSLPAANNIGSFKAYGSPLTMDTDNNSNDASIPKIHLLAALDAGAELYNSSNPTISAQYWDIGTDYYPEFSTKDLIPAEDITVEASSTYGTLPKVSVAEEKGYGAITAIIYIHNGIILSDTSSANTYNDAFVIVQTASHEGTKTVNFVIEGSASSGGGGGSSTGNASGGGSGEVQVTVSNNASASRMENAIEAAQNEAETGDEINIEIKAGGTSEQALGEIPAESFDLLIENEVDSLTLSDSNLGELKLDSASLAAIANGADEGNITIILEQVSADDLNESQQSAVGASENVLIFDLIIKKGNTIISDFGDGEVTVSFKYDLPDGINAEDLEVYFIDEMGNIQAMNAVYDAESSTITFTTDHFSYYVVSAVALVEAVEPQEPSEVVNPFSDVAEDDWFYDEVMYAYAKGLLQGTSDTTFLPNLAMNRAMVWTVLARMEGVETEGGEQWYSLAQEWAMANEISDGENPLDEITREQFATMLYRYEQYKGGGFSGAFAFPLDYPDAETVSDWAWEAMLYMTMVEVITGMDDGSLTPQGMATRAQVATMLMRYLELE